MTAVKVDTMKLSRETLEILKNYSTINCNIKIEAGSTIKTLSPMKNIMSKTSIDETFDTQVSIWDLNKFLGTVSLYEKPVFEFRDDHVIISEENGKSKTKYRYAESSLISSVDKDVQMPEPVVSFVLYNKDLSQVLKAASVLGLPDLAVRSSDDESEIELVALDLKDSSCNTYSVTLGDNPGGQFTFNYKTENMKMIAGDYDVDITDKFVSQLTNKNIDVTYWIALDNTSKYEG